MSRGDRRKVTATEVDCGVEGDGEGKRGYWWREMNTDDGMDVRTLYD